MEKLCAICGTDIPESETVCPKCGAAFQEPAAQIPVAELFPQDVPVVPEKKRSPVKWWMILIAAVLAVAILVAVLWIPLSVRLAPKAVLASALSQLYQELDQRVAGSPLDMISSVNLEEGYTTVLSIDNSYGTMKENATFTYSADIPNSRMGIDFSIISGQDALDLSLYVDDSSIAASSDALTDGAYYGITYETFLEDVQSNPLLASMDQKTLDLLQEFIDAVQSRWEVSEPNVPNDILTNFISELKPTVTTQAVAVNGEQKKCDVISFTLTNQDLADLADAYLAVFDEDPELQKAFVTFDENGMTGWEDVRPEMVESIEALRNDVSGEMLVSFLLRRNHIVGISLDVNFSSEELAKGTLVLLTGTDASKDDLVLDICLHNPDGSDETILLNVTLNTQKTDTTYEETVCVCFTDRFELTTNAELSYQWNRESGDLTFAYISNDGSDEVSVQADVMLEELENGFKFSMNDSVALAGALVGKNHPSDGQEFAMAMTITEGAQVETPEYKNLDDWSQADLISIMMKMYSLFGYM